MQTPWTTSWTSQHPIQRSTLSEGPRMSSFSGLDETLPWKDIYELRYNSLNLYRSNRTLNLWNLNYPLVPAPPAPHPPRTTPEQRTSGSAPSIGSPPPAHQIIPYTEMSVAVQGWNAVMKGKQLKQPKKSQKGKGKVKGQVYKSQCEQLYNPSSRPLCVGQAISIRSLFGR